MNKFHVSDIRWASTYDLSLPLWQKWNSKNPLPYGFWQRIWEYPYLTSKIPSSSRCLDVGGTYPSVLFRNFHHAISVKNRDLHTLDHPFHQDLWPDGRLIISDAAAIPQQDNTYDHVFSISALEEMPHTMDVIREMIRLARYRVLFTMDVSEKLGFPLQRLRQLESLIGISIPDIPGNALHSLSDALHLYGQKKLREYKDIRVLAVTLDALDTPKSVGILIPHWESWHFLEPSLTSIRENMNSDLREHVYILDDKSTDGSIDKARDKFGDEDIFEFHIVERPNKNEEADVGALIDYGVRIASEQYLVMMDADLFPVNNDWISFPIWLLEKFNSISIGTDTGLSSGYLDFPTPSPWGFPDAGYLPHAGLYSNEYFTCTNNFFRIMTGADAKVVSEKIGFTRGTWGHGTRVENILGKVRRKLLFRYRELVRLFNDRYPYLPAGCDNGVAANQFMDINRLGPKFNLPITSYIGLTPKDGAFGQNICGLVFHYALSTRAFSQARREVEDAGKEFNDWARKLFENEYVSMEILEDMFQASAVFRNGGYDHSIPSSWYENEYEYVQSLYAQYKSEAG